jgi:heme/copper-type cytochrome/quinol oxidase subunit 4
MSETQPESFKNYARRSLTVFCIVICVTAAMVATSFAPIGDPRITIALILTAAAVNACLVAAHLMHLLSERRIVFIVLIFTVIFFVGLMGLTYWATHDIPTVSHH